MGLFSGMMGNASEVSLEQVMKDYGKILARTENIEKAYKLLRDLFIFTNKRLILVNVQGVTGKKVEYHSIPYRAITHYSIETSGHFDLEAELKIWISGTEMPIEKTFNSSLNIYELQAVLAEYCMK